MKKPNVVFIFCDHLNDWMQSLYDHPQGYIRAITSFMDKVANFTNAHSNNPICGPSRISLITRLYPHDTGYFGDDQQPNQTTIIAGPVFLFVNKFVAQVTSVQVLDLEYAHQDSFLDPILGYVDRDI